jgi:hypothetical protein
MYYNQLHTSHKQTKNINIEPKLFGPYFSTGVGQGSTQAIQSVQASFLPGPQRLGVEFRLTTSL